MPISRDVRVALNKKQEKLHIGSGAPSIGDLVNGVPVLRITGEGLIEYVSVSGALYKNPWTEASSGAVAPSSISSYTSGSISNTSSVLFVTASRNIKVKGDSYGRSMDWKE